MQHKQNVSGKDEPSVAQPRRVFIRSYGCQMNVYDATRMADALEPHGYTTTSDPEEAELVVLNTCHIRERAAEKVYSELGKLRVMKADRKSRGLETQIAVAGCVAQAEGAEIIRRQNAVDLVVGPQNYHRLPQLLHAAAASPGVVDTEFPVEDKFSHLGHPTKARLQTRGVSAFVTVQEGCDKFCAFCVVPYTRGAEYSRPMESIVDEVNRLVDAGVREVTLIGQNVNAYHGADASGGPLTLAALMARIAAIKGLLRIRYTTSHPLDMGDDLIEAHRDIPQLMPYLHLPVQSGSDRVLAAMNRRHTASDYLAVVERVRKVRPDIAFSSDFIVGFPGEADADFQATIGLVERVGFAGAYSFMYSPRPGTPAAGAGSQVPHEVMRDRLAQLQALLEQQKQAFNADLCGRTLEVLFEREGRYPGQLVGKTPYLQGVHVHAPSHMIGSVAAVEIVALSTNSLSGRLVHEIHSSNVEELASEAD